jgi:hypothetical protein
VRLNKLLRAYEYMTKSKILEDRKIEVSRFREFEEEKKKEKARITEDLKKIEK